MNVYALADMRDELNSLKEQRYVGVAELAQQAARILAEGPPVQDRGTVSEVPDERTVRYYLTEGLISPASEKQGSASLFSYRHLLQLLAIKQLQAEHLPIRKIRELVGDRNESDLERILGVEGQASTTRNEAMSYLESLLINAPRSARAKPPTTHHAPHAVGIPVSSASATPLTNPSVAPSPGQTATAPNTGTWERIEVEPGLELHINSSHRLPKDENGLRRLARLILRTLESRG